MAQQLAAHLAVIGVLRREFHETRAGFRVDFHMEIHPLDNDEAQLLEWRAWREDRRAVAAQAGQLLRTRIGTRLKPLGGGWLRYQDEGCGFYRNSVTGEESFGLPKALWAKGRR